MTSIYDIPETDVNIFLDIIKVNIPNTKKEKYELLLKILTSNVGEYNIAPESISDWVFANRLVNSVQNIYDISEILSWNNDQFLIKLDELHLPRYLSKERFVHIFNFMNNSFNLTNFNVDIMMNFIKNLDYKAVSALCSTIKILCTNEFKAYVDLPLNINKNDLTLPNLILISKILSNDKKLYYFNENIYVSDSYNDLFSLTVDNGEIILDQLTSNNSKIISLIILDNVRFVDNNGNVYNVRDGENILIDKNIKELTRGSNHILKLTNDNKVYASGNLHVSEDNPPKVHFKNNILLKDNIVQISSGNNFCLFLDKNGEVYGLGSDNVGQLGRGGAGDLYNVEKLDTPKDIIKIFSYNNISVILDKKLNAYITGSFATNEHDRDFDTINEFTKINEISDIIDVSIGENLIMFLTKQGKVMGIGPLANIQSPIEKQKLINKYWSFEHMITLFKDIENIIEVCSCDNSYIAKTSDNIVYIFTVDFEKKIFYENEVEL